MVLNGCCQRTPSIRARRSIAPSLNDGMNLEEPGVRRIVAVDSPQMM